MPERKLLTTMSAVSLLFSAPVLAHITEPGSAIPHFLTGDHLLMLVIVGVCVAGASKLYRRFR